MKQWYVVFFLIVFCFNFSLSVFGVVCLPKRTNLNIKVFGHITQNQSKHYFLLFLEAHSQTQALFSLVN